MKSYWCLELFSFNYFPRRLQLKIFNPQLKHYFLCEAFPDHQTSYSKSATKLEADGPRYSTYLVLYNIVGQGINIDFMSQQCWTMTRIKSADKDSQFFTGPDLVQSCSLFSTITLKQVYDLVAGLWWCWPNKNNLSV